MVWALAMCEGARWALVCDPVSNRGRLIRADTIVDIQPYQLLRTLTEALIDNHSADSPDSEASAVATGLLRNLLVSRHPGDSLEEHQS